MALSQKALQKKRAKKSEKRKVSAKPSSGLLSFAHAWASAAFSPVADIWVSQTLFEEGIGTIWFTRHMPDGRYAVAAFLVDMYCLGVKNALYSIMEPDEYRHRMEPVLHGGAEQYTREHPAYARKLVEQAVDYAAQWGFKPHADYATAKIIFADVDASACPVSFEFGFEGKPYYISGPNESPAQQKQIFQKLEKHCGVGNFHLQLIHESSK